MRELEVRLRLAARDVRVVGTLAERGGLVWFAYAEPFLASGFELSPLRLPLGAGLRSHRVTPGAPIPGVFNDARPEGWGLKLLHRMLQGRGRPPSSLSPLDELAWLGDRTMGALTFHPPTEVDPADEVIELAMLARQAQAVWSDAVTVVLPQLLAAGGPSGGVRPKALIGLPEDGSPEVRLGESDLPPGWTAWLVKFPTLHDDPEAARRELAWMHMAAAAGLDVPATQTLLLEGVGDAFAVRRFDRPAPGERRHMLSAAGALDADFRVPAADYEHLLKATRLITGSEAEVEEMFRRAVFNVAAVNEDDHLKNVAWLADPAGRWRVSPAYDLTFAPRPYGERWTTVAGTGREVSRGDLLTLAGRAGVRPVTARRVIDQVCASTSQVGEHLRAVGCDNPVSAAAAAEVLRATHRLRG